MKITRRMTILGLVAVLATTVPVLARGRGGQMPPLPPGPGGPGGPGGPPNPAIGMAGWALHELDLGQEQREQIRDLARDAMEGALGESFRAFHDARRAFELVVWDSAAGDGDLVTALQTVSEAATQLELVRHRFALDVLNVLTEEQRATFLQLLETEPPHPGGPGPHVGRGGPGGPGNGMGPGGGMGPGPRDR